MTTASTSLAVTAGPRWNASQAFKAQGESVQFPTLADLNAAIAAGPLWYSGQTVRVIAEPPGVLRRWNGTHCREVIYPTGQSVTLSGDTDAAPAALLPQSPTYGATSTIDAGTSGATVRARLTLTGDTTLAMGGTPADMQTVWLSLVAGTSTRAVTLPGSAFVIPSSSALTSPLSIAANTRAKLGLQYSSVTSKWDVVSFVPGYGA